MFGTSKRKVVFLIFSVLCIVWVSSCVEDLPAVPSPTLSPSESASDAEPTAEKETEEVGEQTVTVMPTETPFEPTEEPTCACASQPTATKTVEATPVVITGGEKVEMIEKVKADLASRLGVSEDEIKVVSAEAKNWSDASLGCPEKGMMYAQVITPGYRIILEVDGTQYDYRTDNRGNFKLCEK